MYVSSSYTLDMVPLFLICIFHKVSFVNATHGICIMLVMSHTCMWNSCCLSTCLWGDPFSLRLFTYTAIKQAIITTRVGTDRHEKNSHINQQYQSIQGLGKSSQINAIWNNKSHNSPFIARPATAVLTLTAWNIDVAVLFSIKHILETLIAFVQNKC